MSFLFISSFNRVLSVFFLIMILSITMIDQDAFGHGVTNLKEQESFIIISDEKFSRQSLKNGQTLTIQGILIANDEINIDKPLSVYLETSKLCTELDVFFTEPKGVIGHVNKGDKIPYQIKLTLDSGVYHAHTMINIESFGQAIGQGTTLVVEDSQDSPQTSEWCDERNNFWIILGTILTAITIIGIMGFLILKRKTPSKSKWSITLILMGFISLIVSVAITFEGLGYGLITIFIGFGLGLGLIISGLVLNTKLSI